MLGITSVDELLRVVNRPRSARRSNGGTCAMTVGLPPQNESHELLRLEHGRNGQRHDIR